MTAMQPTGLHTPQRSPFGQAELDFSRSQKDLSDPKENTPQPLYNTIVGVHSINRIS